jgi:hypothetical protein
MNSALIRVLAVSIVGVALSFGAARAAEPKARASESSNKEAANKEAKVADQARRMIAQDKELHQALTAALKAKDTARIQSLFKRKGLDLGTVHIHLHCFTLAGGVEICDF